MIINGYQAFFNLVNKDNIEAFSPIRNCVATLNKICNCQKARRVAKSEECDKYYINIVTTVLPNMIEYLKEKTQDGEIIFIHAGCHEIKRIKLR